MIVWMGGLSYASIQSFGANVDGNATDAALLSAWTAYLNGWPKGLLEYYVDVPSAPRDTVWIATVSMLVATASNLSMGGALVALVLSPTVSAKEP